MPPAPRHRSRAVRETARPTVPKLCCESCARRGPIRKAPEYTMRAGRVCVRYALYAYRASVRPGLAPNPHGRVEMPASPIPGQSVLGRIIDSGSMPVPPSAPRRKTGEPPADRLGAFLQSESYRRSSQYPDFGSWTAFQNTSGESTAIIRMLGQRGPGEDACTLATNKNPPEAQRRVRLPTDMLRGTGLLASTTSRRTLRGAKLRCCDASAECCNQAAVRRGWSSLRAV